MLLIFGIAAFFAMFSSVTRRRNDKMHIRNAIANAKFSAEQAKMRSRHTFVSMARAAAPPSAAPISLTRTDTLWRQSLTKWRATAGVPRDPHAHEQHHRLPRPAPLDGPQQGPARHRGASHVLATTSSFVTPCSLSSDPSADPLAYHAAHGTQGTIREGSAQILALVEDALSVGQEGTGQFSLSPRVINPRVDVLEKAWKIIRLHRRFADKIATVRMQLDISTAVPTKSLADANRLLQVLVNLLANALQFLPEGEGKGVVRMEASYEANAELLRVVVRDNGRGMSEEGMSRLFRPFVAEVDADGAQPRILSR